MGGEDDVGMWEVEVERLFVSQDTLKFLERLTHILNGNFLSMYLRFHLELGWHMENSNTSYHTAVTVMSIGLTAYGSLI